MWISINMHMCRIGLTDFETRLIINNQEERERIESKIMMLIPIQSNIEVYNIPSGRTLLRISELPLLHSLDSFLQHISSLWNQKSFEWCLANIPERSQYGPHRDVSEIW